MQLLGLEERQPWLCALCRRLPHQLGVAAACLVPQAWREEVVGDHLGAWRERAEGRQGSLDISGRQVHDHPEPAHEDRRREVERGTPQHLTQVARGQVRGDERDAGRYRDARRGQRPPLPVLGRGVVHLDHSDRGGQRANSTGT